MERPDLFDDVFTRVCHVKRGYEDRERHILREFERRGVPADFFLDWDMPDMSPEMRASLFGPNVSPQNASLSLKHRGIWKEFLDSGKPYCLVFEDDVFLAKDFVSKLARCIDELGDPSRHAAVYLGNGGNYYIGWRQLERGRCLYPARHGRCMDSYLITRSVAEARCDWFSKNVQTKGIHHQVDTIDPLLGVEVLWFERPIAEQGTHTGAFKTSLYSTKYRPLWVKKMLWHWKKHTRRFAGRMK